MRRKMRLLVTVVLSVFLSSVVAQTIPPDSTRLASIALQEKQAAAKKSRDIGRLLETGCWKEAGQALQSLPSTAIPTRIYKARLAILQNDFFAAGREVDAVLRQQSKNVQALLLKAELEIQAWRLPSALQYAEKAITLDAAKPEGQGMKGRILVLQKNYTAAQAVADKLLQQFPSYAPAYRLQADIYFWSQAPEKAEKPLLRCLELNPFDADARFSYGYAIWRRIDATQLNAMAAQWELALAINPLHYQTHWHWGNGHTNLTYADYAEKDEDSIRHFLRIADSLVRRNQVAAAILHTRKAEKRYPASVIPLLHRASLYYNIYGPERAASLDSAQAIFEKILARKKHYGPAHNGLSAVIKSRRIPYLYMYDSVMQVLQHTVIPDRKLFESVFDDLDYYPGDMAAAMVWNQLYSSVVYFPFLKKQADAFKIPPLHIDLATCMQSPYFRIMTTFDNRQWMDIRGVGSGAAAIEYVEKGAFMERNVVLHEYVHLFHSDVFTDAEIRAVRRHYYKAMLEHRTLDYYSQNNEHEYLAQTYPAYYEAVKVHPQDFKSMNTTADLQHLDPDMYAFLDSLVKKEKACLSGNCEAFAGNWAQVYINLAQSTARRDTALAARYLDTALLKEDKYLPAYIAKAEWRAEKGDTAEALAWIRKGMAIDPNYAPLFASRSRLHSRFDDRQADLVKAISLETDLQERASLYLELARLCHRSGKPAEAIRVAGEYASNAPVISTYLRDRRDDALADAAYWKSLLGYPEPLAALDSLVRRKPQQYGHRKMYAAALSANGRYQEAIDVLQYARRILAASGNDRTDFALMVAENQAALGRKDSVQQMLPLLRSGKGLPDEDRLRFVNLLAAQGATEEAKTIFATLETRGDMLYRAAYLHTKSLLATDPTTAMQSAEASLALNPYQFDLAKKLQEQYLKAGYNQKAEDLHRALEKMDITPGPSIR